MRFGQYELHPTPLGEGGMGVVYRARHVVLGSPAVVKLLRPEMTQHPEMAERFRREAVAADALEHPHIIGVRDCGQAPNGQWYIALDFLDGVPLSKWIEEPVTHAERAAGGVHRRTESGPVPPAQAVAILCQVASALHAAHEYRPSIVHRDVKPDNIFLVERGGNELFVVLLDFGIAKLSDTEDRAPITRTGIGMGTPAFMAPEQLLNSKDVDRRADVYALGVVLYQMLTGGALPWGQTEAVEIYRIQMTGYLPDPRTIVPSISPALVEVIHRAMAPNREDRWPDAKVFAQVLAEAVPKQGLTPSGPEILRDFAPELMPTTSGSTTIGNRISGSVSAAVASARQDASWPAAPSGHATPYERPGGSLGSSSGVPRVGPTTLGGSAAQSVPNTFGKPQRSRRGLMLALGAAGIAAAVVTAVVLAGGEQRKEQPVAATDASTPVALEVVTEPPGATVFVNDENRGPSPITVLRPTGDRIELRAESPGFVSSEQSHVFRDRPDSLRLTLSPSVAAAPDDAATPVDAAIDAADVANAVDAGAKKTGRGGSRTRGSKPGDSSPPGGIGSGTSKQFDPNSVGGE